MSGSNPQDTGTLKHKIGWLLAATRKTIEAAEHAYRREKLPPPSRAKPRHEPEAIAGAQRIERLSRAVGALQGQIAGLPVPESDPAMKRQLEASARLGKLLEWDQVLVDQAEFLRSTVENRDASWLLENEASIQEALKAITESLRHRQLVLYPAG